MGRRQGERAASRQACKRGEVATCSLFHEQPLHSGQLPLPLNCVVCEACLQSTRGETWAMARARWPCGTVREADDTGVVKAQAHIHTHTHAHTRTPTWCVSSSRDDLSESEESSSTPACRFSCAFLAAASSCRLVMARLERSRKLSRRCARASFCCCRHSASVGFERGGVYEHQLLLQAGGRLAGSISRRHCRSLFKLIPAACFPLYQPPSSASKPSLVGASEYARVRARVSSSVRARVRVRHAYRRFGEIAEMLPSRNAGMIQPNPVPRR